MRDRTPNEGKNILDSCSWRGLLCLSMFPFYAVTFSLAVSRLQGAAHSLGLTVRGHYPSQLAWQEAADAVEAVVAACKNTPLEKWLNDSQKIARIYAWVKSANPQATAASLMELDADLRMEVINYEALLIPPDVRLDFVEPLKRFGIAAEKFATAQTAMTSASKCYALDEWDACVFHAMRTLEHGLRWLAEQINAGPFPLTLKRAIELETWETVIGNIQARINDELRANVPRTLERDALVSFYSAAAAEFRYFKDAWRNHVMHDRNDPYDKYEAARVLEHVATFMLVLASRV